MRVHESATLGQAFTALIHKIYAGPILDIRWEDGLDCLSGMAR